MDELAQCQARITEQQKKLEEIERKREELAQAREKRKLEEEKERIKKKEEAEVRRKRQKLSLSPARAEIETGGQILSCLLMEHTKEEFSKSVHSSFRSARGNCVLLCTGTSDGKLGFWDALDSFSSVTTMELKTGSSIFSIVEMKGSLQFATSSRSSSKTSAFSTKGNPLESTFSPASAEDQSGEGQVSLLVVGVGCDIALLSLWNLSQVHSIEEAHSHEIQVLTTLHDEVSNRNLLFSGALDATVACWDSSTWTCLFRLKGHEDNVLCLLGLPGLPGAPESCRLLSGSDDSTIRVWNVPKCVKDALARANGILTAVQNEEGDTTSSQKSEVRSADPKQGPAGNGKESSHVEERSIAVKNLADATSATAGACVFEKAEHIIKDNSDFISALCRVTIATNSTSSSSSDSPTDIDLVVASSADFNIRVYNRSWECLRVLETSIFATHLVACGTFLFAATRFGDEGDPGKIERWQLPSLKPFSWKRVSKPLNVMPCSTLVAKEFPLTRFAAPTQPESKAPQMALMLLSADEDEECIRVWASPFKIAQQHSKTDQKAIASGQSSPAIPHHALQGDQNSGQQLSAPLSNATSVPLPPQVHTIAPPVAHVSHADTSQTFAQHQITAHSSALAYSPTIAASTSGDALAKRFIRDMLHIPGLSPDMARILRVCLDLHVCNPSPGERVN